MKSELSFEMLYEQHYKDFYNYLLSLTKNPIIAEDLLQEGFLKIFHKLHSLKDAKKFKSWGFQIMTNTFRDWYKKNKRIVYSENMHTIPDEREKPKDTKSIEKILDYMSLKEKQVFILKQYKKMKYKEIAKIIKSSERTVRRLMKSAVTKFINLAEEKKIIVNGHFISE